MADNFSRIIFETVSAQIGNISADPASTAETILNEIASSIDAFMRAAAQLPTISEERRRQYEMEFVVMLVEIILTRFKEATLEELLASQRDTAAALEALRRK